MESFMNFTLPSASSVLAPPECQLLALLMGHITVEPVLLQWVHLRPVGGMRVLKSVCAIAP
jgi:hypothetical protein